MTPRQIYSELAKIAGYRCRYGDAEAKFIHVRRLGVEDLRVIQNKMAALLQKLSYARMTLDFREPREPRRSPRRLRRAQAQEMAQAVPPTSGTTGTETEPGTSRPNPDFTIEQAAEYFRTYQYGRISPIPFEDGGPF